MPVTVYIVVTAGLAVTVAPVVEDNPVTGLHEYVVAPLAVKVAPLPLQNAAGVGTEIVGRALTVAVTAIRVAELQPVVVFLTPA